MARVVPDHAPAAAAMRSVLWPCIARYINDERLRTVFSFHPLLVGGNPFAVELDLQPDLLSSNGNWGVHFAMGGTGRLVHRHGRA